MELASGSRPHHPQSNGLRKSLPQSLSHVRDAFPEETSAASPTLNDDSSFLSPRTEFPNRLSKRGSSSRGFLAWKPKMEQISTLFLVKLTTIILTTLIIFCAFRISIGSQKVRSTRILAQLGDSDDLSSSDSCADIGAYENRVDDLYTGASEGLPEHAGASSPVTVPLPDAGRASAPPEGPLQRMTTIEAYELASPGEQWISTDFLPTSELNNADGDALDSNKADLLLSEGAPLAEREPPVHDMDGTSGSQEQQEQVAGPSQAPQRPSERNANNKESLAASEGTLRNVRMASGPPEGPLQWMTTIEAYELASPGEQWISTDFLPTSELNNADGDALDSNKPDLLLSEGAPLAERGPPVPDMDETSASQEQQEQAAGHSQAPQRFSERNANNKESLAASEGPLLNPERRQTVEFAESPQQDWTDTIYPPRRTTAIGRETAEPLQEQKPGPVQGERDFGRTFASLPRPPTNLAELDIAAPRDRTFQPQPQTDDTAGTQHYRPSWHLMRWLWSHELPWGDGFEGILASNDPWPFALPSVPVNSKKATDSSDSLTSFPSMSMVTSGVPSGISYKSVSTAPTHSSDRESEPPPPSPQEAATKRWLADWLANTRLASTESQDEPHTDPRAPASLAASRGYSDSGSMPSVATTMSSEPRPGQSEISRPPQSHVVPYYQGLFIPATQLSALPHARHSPSMMVTSMTGPTETIKNLLRAHPATDGLDGAAAAVSTSHTDDSSDASQGRVSPDELHRGFLPRDPVEGLEISPNYFIPSGASLPSPEDFEKVTSSYVFHNPDVSALPSSSFSSMRSQTPNWSFKSSSMYPLQEPHTSPADLYRWAPSSAANEQAVDYPGVPWERGERGLPYSTAEPAMHPGVPLQKRRSSDGSLQAEEGSAAEADLWHVPHPSLESFSGNSPLPGDYWQLASTLPSPSLSPIPSSPVLPSIPLGPQLPAFSDLSGSQLRQASPARSPTELSDGSSDISFKEWLRDTFPQESIRPLAQNPVLIPTVSSLTSFPEETDGGLPHKPNGTDGLRQYQQPPVNLLSLLPRFDPPSPLPSTSRDFGEPVLGPEVQWTGPHAADVGLAEHSFEQVPFEYWQQMPMVPPNTPAHSPTPKLTSTTAEADKVNGLPPKKRQRSDDSTILLRTPYNGVKEDRALDVLSSSSSSNPSK